MPFGVVRGVGRAMGVLDWGGDRRRGGAVLGVNLGRSIVINGAFATRSSQITLRTCYGVTQQRQPILTSSDCSSGTFSRNASYILRLLNALLSTILRNVFLFFDASNNKAVVDSRLRPGATL